MAKDYTGLKIGSGKRLPDREVQFEVDRIWRSLAVVDEWARDVSLSMRRITNGQVPDGSGSTIANAGPGIAHNVLSVTHPDTLVGTVVRGDLITGNSTPRWTRLPIGTTNQVLGVNQVGQYLRPTGDSAVGGGWSKFGGGSPLYTAINEVVADNSNYVTFTTGLGGNIYDINTNGTITSPGTQTQVTIDIIARTTLTGTPTGSIGVRFFNDPTPGITIRKTIGPVESSPDFVINSSFSMVTITQTVSPGAVGSGNYYLEFDYSGTASSVGMFDIAWVRITIGTSGGAGLDLEYKTVQGTSNEIDVTHTPNTITIGLVDPLIATKGGTGLAAFVVGDLLYSDTITSLHRLAIGTGANKFLTVSGGLPAWGPIATSDLPVHDHSSSSQGGSTLAPSQVTITGTSDVRELSITPFASQTVPAVTVNHRTDGIRTFEVDRLGQVTVGDTTHTDNLIRLQVNCPSSQTSANNILEVNRITAGNSWAPFQIGGTGIISLGTDSINTAGGIVRLRVNASTTQTGDMLQMRVTGGSTDFVNVDSTFQTTVLAKTATSIPLTVKGASGQSNHLMDWKNNAGTAVAFVEPDGTLNTVANVHFIGGSGDTLISPASPSSSNVQTVQNASGTLLLIGTGADPAVGTGEISRVNRAGTGVGFVPVTDLMIKTAPAGFYLFCCTMECITAGTGNITMSMTWNGTSPVAGSQPTCGPLSLAATGATTGAVTAYVASGDVRWTVAGTIGGGAKYTIRIRITSLV